MKVLVVGCGVIGSHLVHTLMQAGNEVSVVLRGRWKEVVETKGLRIHHVLQKKDTVDHPIVLSGPGDETYDLVFSAMQAEQQEEALTMLSGIRTDTLVLVGNNLHCAEIVEKIHAAAPEKRVLFGFQMSAGERKDTYVEVVRKGGGSMTVGCLHQEPEDEVKEKLLSAFSGTGYRLYWCDDMEGYLWTHAAFILPCVFLSYAHDCNMHHLSLSEIRQAVLAAKEGYRLIERAGMKIRPKEDEGYDTGKSWEILMTAMLTGMSRTKLSDLCITDHCRNAVDEMEDLTSCFETLRQQYPDVPMVHWDALQSSMPSFEILKEQYRKRKPDYANWMPKEMIAGAAAGSAALLAASAALHAAGRKSGSRLRLLQGQSCLLAARYSGDLPRTPLRQGARSPMKGIGSSHGILSRVLRIMFPSRTAAPASMSAAGAARSRLPAPGEIRRDRCSGSTTGERSTGTSRRNFVRAMRGRRGLRTSPFRRAMP